MATLVALLAPAPGAHAATASGGAKPPRLDARSWILVDAGDRATLAARSPALELPVASANKLMTAYLAFQRLRMDRVVRVYGYQAAPMESVAGLRAGELFTVRELLLALLVASGNDAAVELAVAASGSVAEFTAEMNESARRLGLEDSTYANPIGLDAPGAHSSARDLVSLALALRRRPAFREIVDTERATIDSGPRELELVTRNDLLEHAPWVNGIKTGHTAEAGYVLVASATRRGVTLLSAVLGTESEAARDRESLELLSWGFGRYRQRAVLRRGETARSVSLSHRDEELGLRPLRTVRVRTRPEQAIRVRASAPEELEGPIERSERLGRAVVLVDGRRRGSVPLVAARAVAEASWVDRLDSWIPGPRAVVFVLGVGAAGAMGAGGLLLGRLGRRGGPAAAS